jgi:hypothetical protein
VGRKRGPQLGLEAEGDIQTPKVVESLLGLRFMG